MMTPVNDILRKHPTNINQFVLVIQVFSILKIHMMLFPFVVGSLQGCQCRTCGEVINGA